MSFISQIIFLLTEMQYLGIDRENIELSYFEFSEYFNFAYRNRGCGITSFELVEFIKDHQQVHRLALLRKYKHNSNQIVNH